MDNINRANYPPPMASVFGMHRVLIEFDHRQSDSPYVERIWRSRSRQGGSFFSMAESCIEIVFTRLPEFTAVTLRGPVSKGVLLECPPNGEWLAVRFKLGTYLPDVPTASLIDHQSVDLPLLPMAASGFPARPGRFRATTRSKISLPVSQPPA